MLLYFIFTFLSISGSFVQFDFAELSLLFWCHPTPVYEPTGSLMEVWLEAFLGFIDWGLPLSLGLPLSPSRWRRGKHFA